MEAGYDQKAVMREPPETEGYLTTLSELIDALNKQAHEVRERLGQVLRPEGPATIGTVEERVIRDAGIAPLSSRVEALTDEMKAIQGVYRDILHRLAI